MALRHHPTFAVEFLDRGAEDELSLAWNRETFRTCRFVPRTLVDSSQRDTTVELFDRRQRPFTIAPSGHDYIYRPQVQRNGGAA